MKFCQDIVFWHSLASKNIFNYAKVSSAEVIYSLDGRTSKSNYLIAAYYYLRALKIANLNFFERLLAITLYFIRGVKNKIIKRLIL